MRRRLDLAASMVVAPPVMFLDEPTTGLDPQSRLDVWGMIGELVASGTTMLLTTQYLDEADNLATEIAVIDHGRTIALGSSEELKRQVGGERIELRIPRGAGLDDAAEALARHVDGPVRIDEGSRMVSGAASDGARRLAAVVRDLDAAGVGIDDLAVRRPTLDDVFLALTGHAAEEEQPEEVAA
jgi:ABC-2 type transport system ATP-binding protein